MSKEKQIQEYESKQLIDELSKMPPMVIATAYLHAINYTLYGIDVTDKWLTAIQNASALEKAYRDGYYDGLQRQSEREEEIRKEQKKQIDAEVLDKIRAEIADIYCGEYCEKYSADAVREMTLDIIDKYKVDGGNAE